MRIRTIILLSCILPSMSVLAERADTVKVINHPDKVSVVEKKGEVSFDVTGFDGDATKTYNYTIKRDDKGNIKTTETESREGRYGVVLNKRHDDDEDVSNDKDSKFELFVSGLYFGWGHTNARGDYHGTTGTTFEVGILNVLGVGYKFGDRNRLSLGVGYQAKYHELKDDFYFIENSNLDSDGCHGISIEKYSEGYSKTASQLVVHTVQFPLIYAKGFGNRFWAYAGGVMNWNCYAYHEREYKHERTHYNEMTTGLNQRKISFDALLGLQWHGFGVYFRYSPQSVLKENDNVPLLNKSWTLGISLGF